MNQNNQPRFVVENLLEEVQFSPTPVFQKRLHFQLKQQLLNQNLDQNNQPNGQYKNGRVRKTWRWIFSGVAASCLFLGLLIALVPAVQAQAISLLRHFGVPLPLASEGLVISPFTPLAPEKVPEQMIYFASLQMETEDGDNIELRYYGQDSFVVIFETPAQEGDILPQGESIQIGDYEAVIEQIPSGMVLLAAQAPQPWRLPGYGGGGGGGGGSSDDTGNAPPLQLVYTSGTKIIWVQADLNIELLTNLSQEEAIQLAASLKASPQLAAP